MSAPIAPRLDPTRFVAMKLADPTHKLPMPGTARFFPTAPTGEIVDLQIPYWARLKADGSLVPADPAPAPPASAPPAPPVADAPPVVAATAALAAGPTALEQAELAAAHLRAGMTAAA